MANIWSSNMTLSFGKHCGKPIEALVLKEPDYIMWMLGIEAPSRRMLDARNEAARLIAIFDQKPILSPCRGSGGTCPNPATYCTVYGEAVQPVFWCDTCSPHLLGAVQGRIQRIESYRQAYFHVRALCNGRKESLKHLIRDLAGAKGLLERAGDDAYRSFFPAASIWTPQLVR
jgi:hypothetical protein